MPLSREQHQGIRDQVIDKVMAIADYIRKPPSSSGVLSLDPTQFAGTPEAKARAVQIELMTQGLIAHCAAVFELMTGDIKALVEILCREIENKALDDNLKELTAVAMVVGSLPADKPLSVKGLARLIKAMLDLRDSEAADDPEDFVEDDARLAGTPGEETP